MLCLDTCKYLGRAGGALFLFCSCFLSPVLPIRPCFPSRCPWKGETPELMPESLSLLFGKTRFLTCVTCSTCPFQTGDFLRDFIQLGRVLLSKIFLPSFSMVDVTVSIFFCLLWGGNNQVLHSSRFGRNVCVQVPLGHLSIPGWLKLSLMVLQSWSHPFASLRSPRCLEKLIKCSWKRQLADAAASAAVFGL